MAHMVTACDLVVRVGGRGGGHLVPDLRGFSGLHLKGGVSGLQWSARSDRLPAEQDYVSFMVNEAKLASFHNSWI